MLARVCGLGDPVLDIVAKVSYGLLESLHAEPGGSTTVEPEEMARLLSLPEVQQDCLRVPGGSSANVIGALAGLSDKQLLVVFVGMLGSDAAGAEYRQKMQAQGVDTRCLMEAASGTPTGTCLCLVTPDGQRTMRTCLSASKELSHPSQLPPALVAPGGLMHCEGYCLYRPQVAVAAMRAARAAGGKVSLDLASFEVVRGCLGVLMDILREQLVDLLFCNEQEAAALCQEASQECGSTSEQAIAAAQQHLLQFAEVVVVSRGAKGCIARRRGGECATAAAAQCQIVDTVGAGDHFSAGFLYAWLQGASLQACAACGCAAGTAAVQVPGAALGEADLDRLRQQVERLLAEDGVRLDK
ncbi:hypothetical protein N2152v2_004553 [Parachlorella kessleri]